MTSVWLCITRRTGVLRHGLVVLTALALWVVALCLPRPVHAQPPPERRPIWGRVVTAENTPIKGATVTIRRQSTEGPATFWGASVATDANGEFSVPDVEEGSYFISIIADDFVPLSDKPYLVDIATEPLSITLERLATLSLCVYKPEGSVLKKTSVTTHLWHPKARSRSRLQTAIIYDDGKTTISDIIPGKYTVQVLAEGVGVVTLHNVDLYYTEPAKALDVHLHAGGTIRVVTEEIQQGHAPRTFGCAVVMFTAASKTQEVEAASVTTWRDDVIYNFQVREEAIDALITRDGDGILEVTDITPGVYKVAIYSPSHKQVTSQMVEVKVGQTATAGFLVEPVSHGATLEVLVRDEDDVPIADTVYKLWMVTPKHVINSKLDTQLNPNLLPDTKRIYDKGNAFRLARTDKDGKLTFYPVQPGKWVVQIVYPLHTGGSPASDFHPVEVAAQGGSVMIPIFRFQPNAPAE